MQVLWRIVTKRGTHNWKSQRQHSTTHDEAGTQKLLRALVYASEKHRWQRRKGSDEPYINHPIAVAALLAEVARVHDVDVLCAAVLHDVVEDTDATHEELHQHFGAPIAEVVRELTDDITQPKDERKRQEIAAAYNYSRTARLCKLADKLHNLRSLLHAPPSSWSRERVQGYFAYSRLVIDALRGTNVALESALDDVFCSHVVHTRADGTRESYRALPVSADPQVQKQLLERYYRLVRGTRNDE